MVFSHFSDVRTCVQESLLRKKIAKLSQFFWLRISRKFFSPIGVPSAFLQKTESSFSVHKNNYILPDLGWGL